MSTNEMLYSQNMKRVVIFDLDGTLYKFKGGSYEKSALKRRVLGNAQKYIASKLLKNSAASADTLNYIQNKYKEEISIGLEKEFGLNRYDYFNTVWNISAHGIVKKEPGLRKILLDLRKTYTLTLVSDAPRIWINNVLKELQIQDLFRNRIFSGEGNRRKGLGNTFSNIARVLRVQRNNCIAVGDQENTDIIPAKKLGMRTVFIYQKKHSLVADANISSLGELITVLKNFQNKQG